LIRFLSTFVRVSAVFVSLFAFLAQMSVVWLVVRERWRRVRIANRVMQAYCRWGLYLLRVRVRAMGFERIQGSVLLVGNHLSYLDVLLICAQKPTCFVTSNEIRETPFLGLICRMAGCLFVERRNKDNLQNEISELRDGLREGLSITVFPEATSTNGEQILRFRRPLYSAAIDSARPVVPFCINYRRVGRHRLSLENRDRVMWYGDMPFAPHVWRLAECAEIEVDLHFLPPIEASALTAADLAEKSWRSVASVFRPVPRGAAKERAGLANPAGEQSAINLRAMVPGSFLENRPN
jgi:1-acyl-sn-glycerol-3-phosphate acyltransferase